MDITRIKPKRLPVPVAPFSYAIQGKGRQLLFVPNQVPVAGKGDIAAQATEVFENLGALLAEVDGTFEDIVKITWYLTSREHWKPVVDVRSRYFRETWPAATFVLVDHLSREDVLFELNAIVALRDESLDGEKEDMNREIIVPQKFRKTAEPPVFGLKVSNVQEWLFIAGTVPRDDKNVIVGLRDIREQVEKVFENLGEILKEGGGSYEDLAQLNVYLTDGEFRLPYLELANRVFKGNPVPQTILVVKGLHDPEILIELDGVACLEGRGERR
jgi:enamine deaminase RidA (YjgF/YER057c/UK114 family)